MEFYNIFLKTFAAAIEDALSPWNVKLDATPMEPARLVELIRAGGAG